MSPTSGGVGTTKKFNREAAEAAVESKSESRRDFQRMTRIICAMPAIGTRWLARWMAQPSMAQPARRGRRERGAALGFEGKRASEKLLERCSVARRIKEPLLGVPPGSPAITSLHSHVVLPEGRQARPDEALCDVAGNALRTLDAPGQVRMRKWDRDPALLSDYGTSRLGASRRRCSGQSWLRASSTS
jgi:hypothetical protein